MPQASSAERFSLRITTALTVRFSARGGCRSTTAFLSFFLPFFFLNPLLQPSVLESSLHLISFFVFGGENEGKSRTDLDRSQFSLSLSLSRYQRNRPISKIIIIIIPFYQIDETSCVTFYYVEMIKFVYFLVDG